MIEVRDHIVAGVQPHLSSIMPQPRDMAMSGQRDQVTFLHSTIVVVDWVHVIHWAQVQAA